MPTAAELDRLEALTERLGPLAKAAPGELILAEHWNLLVGIVAELSRALLAQDRDAPPAPHEHVDQVSLGWLEPSLRALVQRGPLSHPAAERRLLELAGKLDRVGQRSDSLAVELHELRSVLESVATRDLVREAQLTETQRTLESQSSTSDDVEALREALRSVEVDVRTAVEVGQKLTVEGAQFDPAALIERVKSVEALRERLRRPDGELLDAATVERRLTELTNTLVTEGELEQALSKHRGRIDSQQLEGLEERLRARVATDGEAAARRVTDDLRGELTQALMGVDGKIERGISDAIPGLRETLREDHRTALDTAVASIRDETQALIGERTSSLADELRAELEARELRGREFTAATARELSDAAALTLRQELETRLNRLDAETTRLTGAQTELSRSLEANSARVEQVRVEEAAVRDRQIEAVREEQRAEVGRLERRMTELDARGVLEAQERGVLASRFDELEASQDERSRLVAEEAVRSFEARVDRLVADRVTERLADVDAKIAETVKARSEEAQVALSRTLRADMKSIDERVRAIDRRVPVRGRGPTR